MSSREGDAKDVQWMYQGLSGHVPREDHLTGRRVDAALLPHRNPVYYDRTKELAEENDRLKRELYQQKQANEDLMKALSKVCKESEMQVIVEKNLTPQQQSLSVASASNVIVPANPYLKQEIPHFIRVYSMAPGCLDHLINWNMFSLPQLEYFLGMLNRLCRDDLEEIVSRYEAERMSLQSLISDTSQQQTRH